MYIVLYISHLSARLPRAIATTLAGPLHVYGVKHKIVVQTIHVEIHFDARHDLFITIPQWWAQLRVMLDLCTIQ